MGKRDTEQCTNTSGRNLEKCIKAAPFHKKIKMSQHEWSPLQQIKKRKDDTVITLGKQCDNTLSKAPLYGYCKDINGTSEN